MPSLTGADHLLSFGHEMSDFIESQRVPDECACSTAGRQQITEEVRLLAEQQVEILRLANQLVTLVNQLAGRVEVLEKRENPG
jgi:hypothetical protein